MSLKICHFYLGYDCDLVILDLVSVILVACDCDLVIVVMALWGSLAFYHRESAHCQDARNGYGAPSGPRHPPPFF